MIKKIISSALPLALIIAVNGCKDISFTSRNVDWDSYLGDKFRSHYATLDQVDTSNVDKLKKAWIYQTGDAGSNGGTQIQCNPLVIDGILYGTSPELKLFALDAATGVEKWQFDPFTIAGTRKEINVNRGLVSWSDNKNHFLYYSAGEFLYCINAADGRPVKTFGENGRITLKKGMDRDISKLYISSTSPGVIYKDLLIVGTRVNESNPAAPGDIRAYDIHSGKIEWVFHTIPRPGEPGNDTWEDPNAWEYTGGVNSWAGMSLDEKRGVVYIPTGSATFDFYGGLRKGMNLFSDCILALEASTGKLLWYYQTVHHDLWDRDLPAPPNLITIEKNGRKIDAVAQITKTGYVFVLDRETGEPLLPVDEVSVPGLSPLEGEELWPTQPRPRIPEPFVKQIFTSEDINNLVPDSSRTDVLKRLAALKTGNMFLPPDEKGIIIYPGFDGGGEWGGAGFDQQTGIIYVNANQIPWTLTMVRSASSDNSSELTWQQRAEKIYRANCMVCHGKDKRGSGDFPSLLNLKAKLNQNDILEIINNGRGRMPSFEQISNDEKDMLVAYLLNKDEKRSNVNIRDASGKDNSLMPYNMTGYHKFRTAEGYPANQPPWGTLTAINLNSGETIWQVPLGEYPELTRKGIPVTGTENYGGPVLTSGGLLFIASTPDQKLRAFNKFSGKLLWETTLPAAGFATPSVYMVNGKQYLAIACGGGKLGKESGDYYVAYALPDD